MKLSLSNDNYNFSFSQQNWFKKRKENTMMR